MPIYEYHCEQCGHDFESLVFGTEEPDDCPGCNGKNIRRLMSACGFKSKGAGGETVSSSASSSCGGCAASSCAGCGSA
jgi:putative FmdB family regulatory protein